MGRPEPVRDQDIPFVWSEDELEVYKMPHPIRKVKVNIHRYEVEELAHMKEMFKIHQIFIGLKKNQVLFFEHFAKEDTDALDGYQKNKDDLTWE